jgi:hypothetical protein
MTREEALQSGSKYYFTGEPCSNGHTDKRYTNTNICYECKRLQAKRDYANHKDRTYAINERSRRKNWDKVLAGCRRWRQNNIEKSNASKKACKIKHRERYLLKAREYSRLKRRDPVFRLNASMSLGIWKSLRKEKGGRHWETLVGYTLEELKAHFEARFTVEMTWDNYGTYWEIDHITPKSLCLSFAETWELSNLQPLECSKNRSKCNRFVG